VRRNVDRNVTPERALCVRVTQGEPRPCERDVGVYGRGEVGVIYREQDAVVTR